MKTFTILIAFVIATLSPLSVATAQITIETVMVGDVGNAADTTGYGAVAYSYAIGKYEVTNTQYAAFLNAKAATDTYGLYSTGMAGIARAGSSGSYIYTVNSGYENKAVNYVTYWDAARFANWLNNGQGNADTETGSYTLTSGDIAANSVTRNVGANWVITSENEWYKAAYYDSAKSGGAGYWLYPTRSDSITAADANYNAASQADVSYGVASSYGTYGQGGSLWEWNEAVSYSTNRGLRGGSWANGENTLWSSFRDNAGAAGEYPSITFRVASLAAVPEPSAYAVIAGAAALLGAVTLRRRQGR